MSNHIQWTTCDEELLDELLKRRASFQKTFEEPVFQFMTAAFLQHAPKVTESRRATITLAMTNHLVQNADEVRDLLKPFDSGVRVDKAKSNT